MERNRAFVGTEGRMSVCYDSAPVPVRAKAANRKRVLSELEPDQPEPGSALYFDIQTRRAGTFCRFSVALFVSEK